jgi:protein phosphatase
VTEITLPSPALIVVLGVEASGGGALVERLFEPHERVRAADLRLALGSEGRAQAAPAWRLLEQVVEERLRRACFTVVELESWPEHDVIALLTLARRFHLVAVVCGLEPTGGEEDERRHLGRMLASVRKRRGVEVQLLEDPQAVASWAPTRLPWDRRELSGPFDVIGDVHGCLGELEELLERLGYAREGEAWSHPQRTLVFLGDLTDRGPANVEVLCLAEASVRGGHALCVLGNHDDKLRRHLEGRKIKSAHGLQVTLNQLQRLPSDERQAVAARALPFLESLPSHLVLDGGRLVVAHAGLSERLIGGVGGKVRSFALYGDTTGRQDGYGLPERRDWAAEYRGSAAVAYGHTPTPQPVWRYGTANVDQGCVFGGSLTAMRWPERTFVSVQARRTYDAPRGGFRPLLTAPPLDSSWTEVP